MAKCRPPPSSFSRHRSLLSIDDGWDAFFLLFPPSVAKKEREIKGKLFLPPFCSASREIRMETFSLFFSFFSYRSACRRSSVITRRAARRVSPFFPFSVAGRIRLDDGDFPLLPPSPFATKKLRGTPFFSPFFSSLFPWQPRGMLYYIF